VTVTIANPSDDAALNERIADSVRKSLALFPGSAFSRERANAAVGQARRNPAIADVSYDLAPGAVGDLDVSITVVLTDAANKQKDRGFFLTGDRGDLPVLYDRNGTILRYKLDLLTLYYANDNAWYGRPDLMLSGNPLVSGTPAGAGWDQWGEAYLHYGLYGITPLSDNLFVYGGLSAITSGSAGQELFTDETRTYTGVEDAYVGFVTGRTDETGNRLTFNLSAGRQRFTLANAFLIANTGSNGSERAALQVNARWSSEMLVLGHIGWNTTKLEAFHVDPDELPILDTETVITGVNVESVVSPGLLLAASYLTVPRSRARRTTISTWMPAPAMPNLGIPSRRLSGRPRSATGWPISRATIPRPRPLNAGTRFFRAVTASNGCRAPAISRWCRILTSSRTGFRLVSGIAEGRAGAPALGLLCRPDEQYRRQPGADLHVGRRIRLRGERDGEDATRAKMIAMAVEAFGAIDAALNNAGVLDGDRRDEIRRRTKAGDLRFLLYRACAEAAGPDRLCAQPLSVVAPGRDGPRP
jgi:hypothetical protein